ncbi:MAG: hypothetical protein M0R32_02690 [Candidatus Cloacimonetes bacterium]|nr:hypothetical protein [Candidatus Cloacimonadota bacterium]
MPSVTIREYNPTTGALIGNISALSFGRVSSGTTSPVKVIDFAFTGVSVVRNVKLGLTSSGDLTVNDGATGIISDGSSENGYFGIEHTSAFSPITATGPVTRHFAGVNETDTAGDANNVEIGKRSSVVSQFVYLDIQLLSNNIGTSGGTYKIYFDFE